MKAGEIALARLQQADGRLKTRPVLVLSQMPPFSDHLVCALSSKLQHECVGFDEVIAAEDDDFPDSGLKVSSLIRLGMVATIPNSSMLGILGRISVERLNRSMSRLARHLMAEQ
jgi:mRNA interferase MazF